MASLPGLVTKMISSIPACRASSTPYWMSGLSTTGSISLGIALVAGRKRVPSPPTGTTALRMVPVMKRYLPRGGQDCCEGSRVVLPQGNRGEDRKSVGSGKSVEVRVDLAGRRSIKKKKK